MRTRVKVCGLTTVEDAREVAQAGVDALGLVFYAASPRAVTLPVAQAIRAVVPPFVTLVGLFVNHEPEEVERICQGVALDCLQFHGDESPADCDRYGLPFIKAARVQEGFDLVQFALKYEKAQGILVDAYVPGVPGGTGQTFDWGYLPTHSPYPVVVSGGLTAHNVGEAICQVHPWAVDVSSGVEREPGRKDRMRVRRFLAAVAEAQRRDGENG
jgi:phosphoribosylanthranilate isomerase (EC 5.3.1.24)